MIQRTKFVNLVLIVVSRHGENFFRPATTWRLVNALASIQRNMKTIAVKR